MTLGELRAKLAEIPADYPDHATVLLEDDETGWQSELTEVSWDERKAHGMAPDDPDCVVWLYGNSK
jgi:hypothetical protein